MACVRVMRSSNIRLRSYSSQLGNIFPYHCADSYKKYEIWCGYDLIQRNSKAARAENYIYKLPINRPSGRYVKLRLHVRAHTQEK
jgi:hypothetical protein